MTCPVADNISAPTLDHLALASADAWDNVIRYCYHLGARWLGGPDDEIVFEEPGGEAVDTSGNPPFFFSQVELAGGTKLEFLQPIPGPGSEFLRRFINRNGPGPHHVTFKVPDIRAAIADVNASGYDVVNESFDNPDWQEAFLHPKQSHGIVVQLAQPGGETLVDDPSATSAKSATKSTRHRRDQTSGGRPGCRNEVVRRTAGDDGHRPGNRDRW